MPGQNQNSISVSLGDLVAAAFDEAAEKGRDNRSVALLASQVVLACLEKSKRHDVTRRLQTR
jgi:metal-responsive CopG/Arc/MetJ family transcriptional regulator